MKKQPLVANFLLLIVFLSPLALLGDEKVTPYISKGNLAVAGSASLSHTGSNSGGGTLLGIAPEGAYFILDYLALGGALNFSHQFGGSDTTNLGIGPSATYFFQQLGNGWLYAKEKFYFQHTFGPGLSSGNSVYNALSVGLHYFLNSSVAFGPAFQWAHNFTSDASSSISRESFSLTASLSIYIEKL